MNPVNYQETIVIPTLQKKIQDLQASNLVLEISLLVEQAKIKDITSKYQTDIGDVSSKDGTILNLKTRLKESEDKNTSLEQEINRERSLKQNAIGEYSLLKEENNKLKNEIVELNKKLETKIAKRTQSQLAV